MIYFLLKYQLKDLQNDNRYDMEYNPRKTAGLKINYCGVTSL